MGGVPTPNSQKCPGIAYKEAAAMIFTHGSVNSACLSHSVTREARAPYESSLKLRKKLMNLELEFVHAST